MNATNSIPASRWLAGALALSLAANLFLLTRRALDRAEGAASPRSAASAPTPSSSDPVTGEGAAVARALHRGDHANLRAQLRAAGLDDTAADRFVADAIRAGYADRLAALRGLGRARRWWSAEDQNWDLDTKDYRAAKALEAEVKAKVIAVLGHDPAGESLDPFQDRRVAYVAPEKRAALQEIEADYLQLLNAEERKRDFFTLPEDVERVRLLQAEKRRDLEALLTPQELADYDLRSSGTAQQMGFLNLELIDATEEEYRAIFELKREFDERHVVYGTLSNEVSAPDSNPERDAERQKAEDELRKQMREALGPDRYKALVRAGVWEFQNLHALARRLQLPAGTAEQVFDLRDEVPAAALSVADDPKLSPAEKRAALAKLAGETRARVEKLLGEQAATAYLNSRHGNRWLKELEKGVVKTFDEQGRETVARTVGPDE